MKLGACTYLQEASKIHNYNLGALERFQFQQKRDSSTCEELESVLNARAKPEELFASSVIQQDRVERPFLRTTPSNSLLPLVSRSSQSLPKPSAVRFPSTAHPTIHLLHHFPWEFCRAPQTAQFGGDVAGTTMHIPVCSYFTAQECLSGRQALLNQSEATNPQHIYYSPQR